MLCVCGCGAQAVHEHHVVYAQHIPKEMRRDPRNLVPVAFGCHAAHHARSRPLELWTFPDSVFEFAAEALGAEPAYVYLTRRYRGDDPRVDALLESYGDAA